MLIQIQCNCEVDDRTDVGGPGRTRTCDLPVRRLMQDIYLVGSSVVYLIRGTRFSLVFGSKLFTDLFTTESGSTFQRASRGHAIGSWQYETPIRGRAPVPDAAGKPSCGAIF